MTFFYESEFTFLSCRGRNMRVYGLKIKRLEDLRGTSCHCDTETGGWWNEIGKEQLPRILLGSWSLMASGAGDQRVKLLRFHGLGHVAAGQWSSGGLLSRNFNGLDGAWVCKLGSVKSTNLLKRNGIWQILQLQTKHRAVNFHAGWFQSFYIVLDCFSMAWKEISQNKVRKVTCQWTPKRNYLSAAGRENCFNIEFINMHQVYQLLIFFMKSIV